MYYKKSVNKLSKLEAIKELEYLSKEIHKHNELYHVKNNPIIDDIEYDKLYYRNKEIEKYFPKLIRKDSPSFKIGSIPSKKLLKIKHNIMMLSLENAFTKKDLSNFINRIYRFFPFLKDDNLEFLSEPKIDGLSLSLCYEKGYLVSAATRGDGYIGESVIDNIKFVSDIPIILKNNPPKVIEVRGEVYMKYIDFIELNKMQKIIGSNIFSNPRNAASGSLRNSDPINIKYRKLHFFAYAMGKYNNIPANTQFQMLKCLENYGFSINNLIKITNNINDMIAYYFNLQEKRKLLDYPIDGVVHKINKLILQKRFGCSLSTPRWAIAHKFSSKKCSSILRKIDITVGRTGKVNPIAKFDPIIIDGIIINSATLHNENYICKFGRYKKIKEKKDIRIGDTIIIERSGDVIPKIVDIVLEKRPINSLPYIFPKICPFCKNIIIKNNNTSKCTGALLCPSQAISYILHFVSLEAFNIIGLGKDKIKFFFYTMENSIKISSPEDIFSIERRQKKSSNKLENFNGFGKKSVEKLYNIINIRRKIELKSFIYALGIPHIGINVAKNISSYYKSYSYFEESVKKVLYDKKYKKEILEEMMSISNIGKIHIKEILSFFHNKKNIYMIDKLLSEIEIVNDKSIFVKNSLFFGKKILFTGSMKSMSRKEAKIIVENLGAKVYRNHISKKLDLIIIGEKYSKIKIERAKNFNIKIINEEDWKNLIKY